MSGFLKFSAFKRIQKILSNYWLVGYNSDGNFKITFKDFIEGFDLDISTGGGTPIFFDGLNMPNTNNLGQPLSKGDWALLEAGKTYININGGANISAPVGRWSIGAFDGDKWVLKDMGVLPVVPIHDGFDLESPTISGSAKNDAWLYRNIHIESGFEQGVINKVEGESYDAGRTVIDVMFPFNKIGNVNITFGHKGLSAGKIILFEKVTEGSPANVTFKAKKILDVSLIDGLNTFNINVLENTFLGIYSESGWVWNTPIGVTNSYYIISAEWVIDNEYTTSQSARLLQFSYQYADILVKDALSEVIVSQEGLQNQITDLNTITEGDKIYGKQSISDITTGRPNLRLGIDINPLSNEDVNVTVKSIDLVVLQVGEVSLRFYEKIGSEYHLRASNDVEISQTGVVNVEFPSNFIVNAKWHFGAWSNDGQVRLGMTNVAGVNSSIYVVSGGGPATVVTGATSTWDIQYSLTAQVSKTINQKFNEIDSKLSSIGNEKMVAFAVLNGTSPTVNASGWYRCCPVVPDVDGNEETLGCTGFAWDSKRDLFLVSEYAFARDARLLIFRPSDLVDRNTSTGAISTPFKIFSVFDHIRNIQGCMWDSETDTYLVIGVRKTGGGYALTRLNPFNGAIIDVIPGEAITQNSALEPGMLDTDFYGNFLFKPNNSSDLYYVDNQTLTPIKKQQTLYHEGLGVNRFNGEIWVASQNNFALNKYDRDLNLMQSFTYQTFPNENDGANVEGMVVYKDGGLIMSADCYLHSPPSGKTINGNALYFFDFDKTVNKRLYFDATKSYKGDGVTYSEILQVDGKAVGVNANVPVLYRSGDTIANLLASAFSETFVSGNYIQIAY